MLCLLHSEYLESLWLVAQTQGDVDYLIVVLLQPILSELPGKVEPYLHLNKSDVLGIFVQSDILALNRKVLHGDLIVVDNIDILFIQPRQFIKDIEHEVDTYNVEDHS